MRHLDYTEIERIQTLRWENRSQKYIADKVGKHQSTISRFCSLYTKEMKSTDIWDLRKDTRNILNKSIHLRILPWIHLEKYIIFRLTGTEEIPLRGSPDQIAWRWREGGEQWGYLLSHHTKKKTAWNICDGLRDMFDDPNNPIPKEYKKTLTSDNWREFAYHKIISHETGMKFYFAHLYSPWRRWTNENTNWLLRQFIPKKPSFAGLTQNKLQTYNKSINSRPRKRHNYRTPEEIFFGQAERLTDLCNLN